MFYVGTVVVWSILRWFDKPWPSPAVLCLVETQLQNVFAETLAQSFGYDRSFAVGGSGRSGGLVIYYNDSIKLEVKGQKEFLI